MKLDSHNPPWPKHVYSLTKHTYFPDPLRNVVQNCTWQLRSFLFAAQSEEGDRLKSVGGNKVYKQEVLILLSCLVQLL